MNSKQLVDLAVVSLDELKAVDIKSLPVAEMTDITDYMVIASGNSSRHVSSIVDHLLLRCRENQVTVIGVEGQEEAEWVLIDLVDVVVHVMLPETREFYDLERLWGTVATMRKPERGG